MLTTGSPAWSMTTPLPRALVGLKMVTTGGKLYATGLVVSIVVRRVGAYVIQVALKMRLPTMKCWPGWMRSKSGWRRGR